LAEFQTLAKMSSSSRRPACDQQVFDSPSSRMNVDHLGHRQAADQFVVRGSITGADTRS
jgi:hypothetical protein